MRCSRLFPLRAAVSLLFALFLATPPAGAVEVRDVLGSVHVAGKYNFTDQDFLNEGADRLLELGTRVIKVWFKLDADSVYSFNSDWFPEATNYVELAQKPYYQKLFAKPFNTFILVVPPIASETPFLDAMGPREVQAEREAFYQLARYLLTAYAGTGKTFVLQNWEGDHLLRQGLADDADPAPARLRGMRDWWNARQEGVERAREEVGMNGVVVAHAAEVNLLTQAMTGRVTAANDVIPYIHADLYSYSSWDVGFDRTRLVQALDYLKAKAPDSALYGADNIYLGEFGAVRDQVGPNVNLRDLRHGLAETALGWGARWVMFWQLYCSAASHVYHGRPTSSDLRGFWLISPDGSKTPLWQDFHRRMPGTIRRVSLGNSGRTASAEVDGTLEMRRRPDASTLFALTDWNGGTLTSGDAVSFQTRDGFFWTASGKGGAVTSRAVEAETFTIWRLAGKGEIQGGDAVAFQTAEGEYLLVADGGALNTGPGKVGPASTFRLQLISR